MATPSTARETNADDNVSTADLPREPFADMLEVVVVERDGLICERLKFCDLSGGEAFILRNEAQKTNLPTLYLERELYAGSEGQLKTRVQARLMGL